MRGIRSSPDRYARATRRVFPVEHCAESVGEGAVESPPSVAGDNLVDRPSMASMNSESRRKW
jgi:hypothetical protein